MAARQFKQLTFKDRQLIFHFKKKGYSLSEIARRIYRNKSTISRELKRNTLNSTAKEQIETYCHQLAIPLDEFNVQKSKIKFEDRSSWAPSSAESLSNNRRTLSNKIRRSKTLATQKWVKNCLKDNWSPEQIAGRSSIDGPEKVSYEYVYDLIKKDRKKGGKLYQLLKRFGKRKQRFASREYVYASTIKDRTCIEERPAIVDKKKRTGDLEADLIQGYRSSGYILTILDRRSRLVRLRKLKTKTKKEVTEQILMTLKSFKTIHTLTVDNGREFSGHKTITKLTGAKVYFCHPYTSSERGAVENANGLIRQFYPKKTCFKKLNQTTLNNLEKKLNSRPRKCLDYLTPLEVHRIDE
jgi:IS30 family transposase